MRQCIASVALLALFALLPLWLSLYRVSATPPFFRAPKEPPLPTFAFAAGAEATLTAPLGAPWPPPPAAPFPASSLAYGRAPWLSLQPHAARFLPPERVFERAAYAWGSGAPSTPRVELENGERMPLYPLGYADGDTGAITQWRIGEGPIVSYVVQNEQAHFEALHFATRACVPGSPLAAGGAHLVLDVGANHGIFGFMALARGCTVEFYDPQRNCADILEKTLAAQAPAAAARGRVFGVPVGAPGLTMAAAYKEFCSGRYAAVAGQRDTAFLPERGHEWGEAYAPFPGFRGAPQDLRELDSVTLDAAIAGRRVAFLKIDVEGFEGDVVASGLESFKRQLVDVLVVEVSPVLWSQHGWDGGDVAGRAAPFLTLLDAGYRCAILRGREALPDPAAAFPRGLDGAALLAHLAAVAGGAGERHGCSGQCDYIFVSARVLEEEASRERTEGATPAAPAAPPAPAARPTPCAKEAGAALPLALPTRCVVGTHAEHWAFFASLINSTAPPYRPFALIRYGDGERTLLQGGPVSADTQAGEVDKWTWGGGDSLLARDMDAGLRSGGAGGSPLFVGFASPRDDEPGLRFFMSRAKPRCERVTFANLWANALYPGTVALLRALLTQQARRVVLVANEEAVRGCAGCAAPPGGAGALFGCVALPDDAVNAWGDAPTRERILGAALALAADGAANGTTLLFIVSGGPLAKAFIPRLQAAAPVHQYVDFGSSTDRLLKGRATRYFAFDDAPSIDMRADPSWACPGGAGARCVTALEDAEWEPRNDAPWLPTQRVTFPATGAGALVHPCAAAPACAHAPAFWDALAAGAWEPAFFSLLHHFLRRGGQYIEIGAWVGPTALFAATLASRVHALEPDPAAFRELASNFALNPALARRARLYRGCVWTEAGARAFPGAGRNGTARGGAAAFEAHCVHPNGLAGDMGLVSARAQGDGWVELVKVDAGGDGALVVPHMFALLQSLGAPPLLLTLRGSGRDAASDARAVEALALYPFAYALNGEPVAHRGELCADCTLLFSKAPVHAGAFPVAGA